MSKKEQAPKVNENELVEEHLGEVVDDLPKTKETIDVVLSGEVVVAESNDLTRELYDKTRYGEPTEDKKFQYSLIETYYLMERGKFVVLDNKSKKISNDD